MHTACKQELRRPRRVEAAAGKASRLGRRKAAANPVPIALDAAPAPAVKIPPKSLLAAFPALTQKRMTGFEPATFSLGS